MYHFRGELSVSCASLACTQARTVPWGIYTTPTVYFVRFLRGHFSVRVRIRDTTFRFSYTMKSSRSFEEESERHPGDGWSQSPLLIQEDSESLRDDDASASTMGPCRSFVRLDPADLCLAPMSGKRLGMLCRHVAGCRSSGHREKRQDDPPKAGFYSVLLDGPDGNIVEIQQEGYMNDETYQAQVAADKEADRLAMAQMGTKFTPPVAVGSTTAVGAPTERRSNVHGAPPRNISFPSTQKKGSFPFKAEDTVTEDNEEANERAKALLEVAVAELAQREADLQAERHRFLEEKAALAAERMALQRSKLPTPRAPPPPTNRGKIYAVARGRQVGVYSTWEACQRQVDGFPGATHKSFHGDQALEQAQAYILAVTSPTPADALLWKPPSQHGASLTQPTATPQPVPIKRPSPPTVVPTAPTLAPSQVEQEKIRKIQDKARVGGDMSTGTKGKAFGFDVRDNTTIQRYLSPYELPTDLANQVLSGMVDVLAMPYQSAAEEPVQQMAAAIEMLTNERQGASQLAPSLKTIGAKSKTALAKVKSRKDLQDISSLLNDPDLNAMASVLTNMTAPFIVAMPDDEELAETKAMQSLPFRIMEGTLEAYRDLVRHLGTVYAETGSWEPVEDQLAFHVTKINAVRSSYSGRFQIAMRLYIYMREGRSKSWRSSSQFELRLSRLEAKEECHEGPDAKGSQKYVPICKHCSGAHVGARGVFTKCPFAALPAEEAREAWATRSKALNQKEG